MRISWPAAARLGAFALAAGLALALLPLLLRTPEPPPIDPEIGLVAPVAGPVAQPERHDSERAPVESVPFERAEHARTAAEEEGEGSGGDAEQEPEAEPPAAPVPVTAPNPPVTPSPAPAAAPPPPPASPPPAPSPSSDPAPEPEVPAGYEEFGP